MRKPLLGWMTLSAAMAMPIGVVAQDEPVLEPTPVGAETAVPPAEAAPTAEAAPAAQTELATVPVDTAEAPAAAAPERRSGNRMIEEIVVTAQKREEKIQDVPIAITAFSAEKLDALGIQSAQDLERITPGLTITNAAGFNVAYLRGIGTDAFLPGADSSVPFYLDGVALLGAQGSSDTLGRVQRVEVLKGPQGTLFGRNATGGAVNIITPDPTSDVFSGDINFDYGNYNASKALIYLNVPITDGLAASLSAFSTQQDNFYSNDAGPLIDIYSRGGRGKLRWDVTDTLGLTLSGSYQESSNNGGLSFENTRVAPILCPGGICALPQDPKADRRVSLNSLAGAETNSYLIAATVDWALNGLDTKLILSDQKLDAPFVQADFDKSALPIVNIQSIKQLAKQRTAELQFLSNDESAYSEHFEWVAGLFYLESSGGFNPIAFDVAPGVLTATGVPNLIGIPGLAGLGDSLNGLLTGLGVPPLGDGVRLYNYGVLDSKAISAYLQGTYHVTEKFDLTLGIRYQDERRNLLNAKTTYPLSDGTEIPIIPASGTIQPPELHAKQTSPRVALQWRPFEDESQIYTSWSRAFKSPTYNTVNLIGGLTSTLSGVKDGSLDVQSEIKPVKAERVDTYELGIKTELLDRNLRMDAAVFYTRQKDLLTGFVAVLSGGIVTYANAPAAEIKGAEADFLLTPMPDLNPGLVVTGSVSYLDAQYTKYPNGKGFDEATGLAFGNGGTEVLPARDFKGNRIVRTPKYTYNLGIGQTINVTDGSIELGADTGYNSGFFFLPQNSDLYKRNAYQLYNARVTYIYDPWAIQASVFVNNLTNENFNEVVFVDDFGRNQVLNAPRTFGLRLKWTF